MRGQVRWKSMGMYKTKLLWLSPKSTLYERPKIYTYTKRILKELPYNTGASTLWEIDGYQMKTFLCFVYSFEF